MLSIIILNLLLSVVWCQPNSLHLINGLSDFYNFDHHIYLIDSSADLNLWFPSSSQLNGIIPRTVYTVDKLSERIVHMAIPAKNAFLVVVVGDLTSPQLLLHIKTIRGHHINVRNGIFLTKNITSLTSVEKLLRKSCMDDIVNIFVAFHLSVGKDKPSSFNVFKYDPFRAIGLINVTRSESFRDYFSDSTPNYQKQPLRFTEFLKIGVRFFDKHFWETVVSVFNASMSLARISVGRPIEGDILIHEQKYIHGSTYPHQQAMLVMIVPHAQPYSDFIEYVRRGNWMLLFVYAVIVIVSSLLLLIASGYLHKQKILLRQCVIDILNILMNDNATIRYGNLHRADVCVIVPLTFTGLIVTNGILSVFESYITVPIYQPQINSLNDLYASSVPILASEVHHKSKVVKWLEVLSKRDGWTDKVYEMSLKKQSKEVKSFNNSIAFFASDLEAGSFLEVQRRLNLKAYHLLSGNFFDNSLSSYLIRPDFPYIEAINDIIHRLNGAGLIGKWTMERNAKMVKMLMKRNRNRHIKIGDESGTDEFTVPTAVWCGWIASVVAFIFEIIWHKVQDCMTQRRRLKCAKVKKNVSK